MNWFERMFSIDEMRVSALVLCLMAVIASCLVSYFLLGTIDGNLLSLADSLIYSVAGLSGIGIGASAYKSVATTKNEKSLQTIGEDNLGTYTPESNVPPKI